MPAATEASYLANDQTFPWPLRKCVIAGTIVVLIFSALLYGLYFHDLDATNYMWSFYFDILVYALLLVGAMIEMSLLVLIWIVIEAIYFVMVLIGFIFALFGYLYTPGILYAILNALLMALRLCLFWVAVSYYYKINNGFGYKCTSECTEDAEHATSNKQNNPAQKS